MKVSATILCLLGCTRAIDLARMNHPGVTFYPQVVSDPSWGCGSGGCDQFKLKYDNLSQKESDSDPGWGCGSGGCDQFKLKYDNLGQSDPICSSAGCTQYLHPYGNMPGKSSGAYQQAKYGYAQMESQWIDENGRVHPFYIPDDEGVYVERYKAIHRNIEKGKEATETYKKHPTNPVGYAWDTNTPKQQAATKPAEALAQYESQSDPICSSAGCVQFGHGKYDTRPEAFDLDNAKHLNTPKKVASKSALGQSDPICPSSGCPQSQEGSATLQSGGEFKHAGPDTSSNPTTDASLAWAENQAGRKLGWPRPDAPTWQSVKYPDRPLASEIKDSIQNMQNAESKLGKWDNAGLKKTVI